MRRPFGPNGQEITGGRSELRNEEVHNSYY
jgi:hypothetical protein